MKIIKSSDNKTFKYLASLSMKKYRDKEGCYLLEGSNLVREALNMGFAKTLILRDGYEAAAGGELIRDGEAKGIEILIMDEGLFSKIAQTKTSQGVMALVKKVTYSKEDFQKRIKGGKVIVLEGLQDPGNIGTVLRTAAGAGYKGAVAIKGTADIYSPKIVRSGAGVVLRMPIYMAEDIDETLELLKDGNRKIYGTSPRGDSLYYQEDFSGEIALVIGNEGNGMSDEFLSKTDKNLRIPMENNTESLNAAVAAGILIFKSVERG